MVNVVDLVGGGSVINGAYPVLFGKPCKISFQKTFLERPYKANLGFFAQPTFSRFFKNLCIFPVLSFRMEHKKAKKTKHQSTFVCIMNFRLFCKFLGIFAALRPSFYIFTIFFQGL